jgi:hypothetical protein
MFLPVSISGYSLVDCRQFAASSTNPAVGAVWWRQKDGPDADW